MIEQETLKEYMKEDAFAFDNISIAICKEDTTDYTQVLKDCDTFEKNVVLFKIVPSFYVMKTILCFKLQDFEEAHKYINGSLKYLVYVAKNSNGLTPMEEANFDEYKGNVLNQYKILLQEKPEYKNMKSVIVPESVKFITTDDEALINAEIESRVLRREK